MSDTEETYCRLCAEPTPLTQLISSEEDVAISSKIETKMLWINVDVSASNKLPTTICFSCFDSLERTWIFLHNVRTAQEKLTEIFAPKLTVNNKNSTSKSKSKAAADVGKPVNRDWEEFQDSKIEVKSDPEHPTVRTVDPSTFVVDYIKTEQDTDDDKPDVGIHSDFNSSDSDLPLRITSKKKKMKKKKKIKYDSEILEADLLKSEIEAVPIDMAILNMTWDDYMCRCASCDALCKNISSLRLHSMQIHSCCCVFKCPDCGKVIANFKNFVNHVRYHKKLLKYCCEYCNKQFSLSAYVKRHINSDHGDSCLTTCQNCGACFESAESLQDHLLTYAKKGRKKEKLEADLKCEECNKEFKSRSNLQQHKLLHTERARNFSCHVCGKMFFTKGTLSTHMSTHDNTKPFKCEFCPMAFRARGNLQSHVSLHSGAKPFVCEQCGKSFRVKRHLKSHSIVHTDLMPYVCEYCNKSFRFKTRLNLHLRQHTGAKPYNCIYCQRDFTNGSNYKKHMKRRHNIDTSKQRYNNIVAEHSNGESQN